jgi:hypothetical protein
VRCYQDGTYTYIEMQTDASPDVDGTIRLVGLYAPENDWFVA